MTERTITPELRELPCPGDWGPAHRWLVMASCHGPASLYGCQHCEATAHGAQIGIDEAWLARAAAARAARAS
jgi:hypothetical protein